jgi:hypothetical protein
MDANRVRDAHPAFVEILRQLTSDEARIMQLFKTKSDYPIICINALLENAPIAAGDTIPHNFSLLADTARCQALELVCSYIDNICRLAIAQIDETTMYSPIEEYAALENHPLVLAAIKAAAGRKTQTQYRFLIVTTLGKQFLRACLD